VTVPRVWPVKSGRSRGWDMDEFKYSIKPMAKSQPAKRHFTNDCHLPGGRNLEKRLK
jgi:hypothetical protein